MLVPSTAMAWLCLMPVSVRAATASAQSATVSQGTSNNQIILSGVTWINPTRFTLVTPPTHGTLNLYSYASYTYVAWTGVIASGYQYAQYTPASAYSGPDSFQWNCSDSVGTSPTVTCTITVRANTTPTATSQSIVLAQNVARVPVALNYVDPDTGQTMSFTLLTAPSNGTLQYNNGSYLSVPVGSAIGYSTWYYTPPSGFTGTNTFNWKVSDGITNSGTATCTITVTPNNPPVIKKTWTTLSCLKNSTNNDLTCFMGYTHADVGQVLTFKLVSAPTNGTLTSGGTTLVTGGTAANNNWIYKPAANYTGPDGFVWNVNDSVVTSSNATVAISVIVPAVRTQPVFKAGVKLMDGNQTLRLYRRVNPNGAQQKWVNDSGYDYAMPQGIGGFAIAAPEVVDWNHDGLMDLLIGEADGRVAVLINQGTKGHPVFNGYNSTPSAPNAFSYMTCMNGQDVLSYKHNCQCFGNGPPCAAPRVVDWDNNGVEDLIIGNWAGYWIPGFWVFPNFGTNNDHKFREKLLCGLSNDYTDYGYGPYGMPFVTDWNDDGVSDVIAGNNTSMTGTVPDGNINVILGSDNNHGMNATNYSASLTVTEVDTLNYLNVLSYVPSNSFLNVPNNPFITITNVCPVGRRKSVVMADLTGTGGIKDIVTGMQDGTVWYAQNTGTTNFPRFSGYTALQAGGTNVVVGDRTKIGQDPDYVPMTGLNSPFGLQGTNIVNEARLAVADLDGDGLPDLIVGEANGYVTVFYQYNPNPFAIDQRVLVYPNQPKNIALTSKVDSSNAVTYTILANPTNGHLSGTAPTNLVYTPNAGFSGSDRFTFTLHDSSVTGNVGTVYISVTNHPPVAQSQVGGSKLTLSMNTPIAVTLRATAVGDESLTYSFTQPAHGTLSGTAPTNLVYTPNADYTGPDSFTFMVNDGFTNSAAATVAFDVITLAVNFGPASAPVSGYLSDTGGVFNAGRGYGWNTSLASSAQRFDEMADPRLDTVVVAGASTSAIWRCNLPNGNYFVTVAYGNMLYQGAIPVILQGQSNRTVHLPQGGGSVTLPALTYAIAGNNPVTVTDGQLTLQIGARTPVNYIEIRSAYEPWAAATYIGLDNMTKGRWQGVYGTDGYWMASGANMPTLANPGWGCNQNFISGNSDIRSIPSYAVINPNRDVASVEACYGTPSGVSSGGRGNTIADPSLDVRALQYPWDASQGIVAAWSVGTPGQFTFDLNFTDGVTHRIAVYCLGWNANGEVTTISILDAGDHTVLDTQVVADSTNGTYRVWDIAGHVHMQVTPSVYGGPAVSAILFGGGGAGPAAIVTQPVGATVMAGQPATYGVTATGTGPLWYQWQKNGVNISGATHATYTTPDTTMGDNGAWLSVVVSNALGVVTSVNAPLTVVANGRFSAWAWQASIQFTGYNKAETLTNFPALVVLGPGITGFAYNRFLSGSNADLRFTDSSGITSLNYEIEQWNTNGNSYVWVQVPALAAYTTIYAYWGMTNQTAPASTTNSATWSANFAGVWHFAESGTGTRNDATTNKIAATASGGPASISGMVGNGINYISSSNQYLVASNRVMNNWPALTISGWFKSSGFGAYVTLWEKGNQNEVSIAGTSGHVSLLKLGTTGGGEQSNAILADGAWHYLSAIISTGAYARLYVDGLDNDNAHAQDAMPASKAGSFFFGRNGTSGYYFNGQQDEVRVSAVERSPSWVWAEYMNMVSNTTFGQYGSALATTNQSAMAPTITAQPTNVTVTAGQPATFVVIATGTAPLWYQWRKAGTNIVSATNAIYTTPPTVIGDTGKPFSVIVSNVAGFVTSSSATLTVHSALVIQSLSKETSGQGMDFMTEAGVAYEVDWKTNLLDGTWLFYTNLVGSGGSAHVSFTNAVPQGFFQIQVVP
jgi:hypothetical protein